MSAAQKSFVLFLLYCAVGFALLVTPYVDRTLVEAFKEFIALASGGLISLFGGSVEINGAVLRTPPGDFAILVDNGCSGLEATILIVAATLAYPTRWRLRLIGALMCSLAIFSVNLLRIISLFYLGQYSEAWFDWAHLYAWDVVIMLDGLIAYALWIRFVRAQQLSA